MTSKQIHKAGLSLIEVLIAVSLLSVGVLGAAALQSSALQGTAKAESLQTITSIAEGEIYYRRQIRPTASSNNNCEAGTPSGYSCTVDTTACTISASAFTCSDSVSFPDAYKVDVTVTGLRGDTTTVTTYVSYDATYADSYNAASSGNGDTSDPISCWPPGECSP